MTLKSFMGSTDALAGAIFLFLPEAAATLNQDLPQILQLVAAHNARFIGMTSGLLQFLVEGEASGIEPRSRMLADEIMDAIQSRGILVWTVQQCSLGCWGDGVFISYGALVPNFQHVMSVLGSAKFGDKLKV